MGYDDDGVAWNGGNVFGDCKTGRVVENDLAGRGLDRMGFGIIF